MYINIYIYIYMGARDLPLQDVLSLGAWRMGLGYSAKLLPPSPLSWSLKGPT